MIVIHYPTAFKALNNYVDRFNSQTNQSTQKLKTAAVATAKEIIRIYGVSLLHKTKNQVLDLKQLPPLSTNNLQLAKSIKCSTRSIQRYIHKLCKANILTSKKYHGSEANYELWINPEILLSNRELTVKPAQTMLKQLQLSENITQVKPPFFESQRTNRLPSYPLNSISNVLKEDNSVDYFEDDFLKNKKNAEHENTLSLSKKISAPGPEAAPGLKAAQNNEQISEQDELMNMHIQLFWLTAKNLLYKYTCITRRQEQTAIALIRQLYLTKDTFDLQTTHAIYIQRIQLAAEYVQRDPVNRFIPLPYIYFDANNPRGFAGTEEWYWKSKKYKMLVDKELLLEKLIYRYLNNNRMSPSRRQPPLKLYKTCEKRLAIYGDENLMNRFYTAVLEFHQNQI